MSMYTTRYVVLDTETGELECMLAVKESDVTHGHLSCDCKRKEEFGRTTSTYHACDGKERYLVVRTAERQLTAREVEMLNDGYPPHKIAAVTVLFAMSPERGELFEEAKRIGQTEES